MNGLYAVIRILTAVSPLVLVVIGDEWEIMLDAPLRLKAVRFAI